MTEGSKALMPKGKVNRNFQISGYRHLISGFSVAVRGLEYRKKDQ